MLSSWYSKFFAAGTFAVAAPSIGYGGYAIWDHTNPTFDKQLRNEGFVWEPIHSNLTHSSEDNSDYVKQFETYYSPCLNKFLTLDVEYANKKMLYKPGSVKNSDSPFTHTASAVTYSGGQSTAAGCAFMKIEKITEDNKQKNKFSSVLFILVDLLAITLFVRGESDSSSESNSKSHMLYSIFRMEKEPSSSGFEVKEGYSWFDKKLTNFNQLDSNDIYYESSSSSSQKAPYIAAPDGSEWLVGSSSTVDTRHYAGIWKSGSSSQKFLEKLKIKDNSSNSGELLGVSSYEFNETDAGYKNVKVGWDVSSKTWKKLSDENGKNLSSTLKNWFDTIKNIQGRWLSFEDYCKDLKKDFGFNRYGSDSWIPTEAKKMKSFCFAKK